MVSRGFDQVLEATCSEATQLEIIEEEREQTLNKKGVKSQVWRVKAKTDGESASNSSTPIQAVGSSESS